MNRFKHLFANKCSVVGMIHLGALPGTPTYGGTIQKILDNAFKELDIYLNNDVDGILIENMNDVPYIQAKNLEPEITASMTRICTHIRQQTDIPIGVQVLAGGNKEALSIALACDLQFIRAEGFVFTHIADEGITDAIAGTLLRYRKNISAENVLVFTDIKKKHSSHVITSDVSLVETAHAAEFFLSDGLILTGTATGKPANTSELKDLKDNVSLPILIGSGVTYDNLENYFGSDALIIGSHFKKQGDWRNSVHSEIVKKFMNKMKDLRQ